MPKIKKADAERFHRFFEDTKAERDRLNAQKHVFEKKRKAFAGQCDILASLYDFDPKTQTILPDGTITDEVSSDQKVFVMSPDELRALKREHARQQHKQRRQQAQAQ